ncbi:MAG TPA: class I SAM-dependent methyltransferase [Devosia sp.]|nr:class I SAM-dependent methyltransferase [Devosia sp.]
MTTAEEVQTVRRREAFVRALDAGRPERIAGGFTRDDGNIAFYTRVNALLRPDGVVLDFGAGRGRQFDGRDLGYLQHLQKFQGKVARVIGIDVYDGVHEHPFLDESHVVAPGGALPLADQSVDVVVADWVLEHIDDPAQFAAELHRVLRPGGWLCARTVNRWGYVALGATIIPNSLHRRVLKGLVPTGKTEDVFDTRYRLNSIGKLNRYFPPPDWTNCSYVGNSLPRYFGKSLAMLRIFDFIHWLTPPPLRTDLFVFVQRR